MRFPLLLCAVIGLSNAGFAASASDCDEKFFDREQLASLLQSGKIEKISDILKLAPDCFKANQVAVTESSSLQCATTKAPRILLYLNDDEKGKSVCSFNSGEKSDYAEFYKKNPKADCHENSMECQHFNSGNNKFEYYEVAVPKKENGQYFNSIHRPASLTLNNPPQCMTKCHRGDALSGEEANPRPNLENYPTWPGFYGSFHDHLTDVSSEAANYKSEYLPYKSVNERYATLPKDHDENLKVVGSNSKPIVNLQNQLEFQNYRRIASEFMGDKNKTKLWPFRHAILGAPVCNDDIRTHSDGEISKPARNFPIESFLPSSQRAKFSLPFQDVTSQALKKHLNNLETLSTLQSHAGIGAFEQFEDEYKRDTQNKPSDSYTKYDLVNDTDFFMSSRLSYLALNLGLPAEDWSMTFKKTFDFEAGRHNLKQLLPILAKELLDPVADQDLKLDMSSYLGTPVNKAQCELLRKKSLAALAGNSTDCPTCNTRNSDSGPAHDIKNFVSSVPRNAPPSNLGLCIGCHVSSGVAPYIPFDNPEKLKAALLKDNLLEDIQSRIDSNSMPRGSVLMKDEKDELKSYFQKLVHP